MPTWLGRSDRGPPDDPRGETSGIITGKGASRCSTTEGERSPRS